tara:strand:- start:127 stop:264 length:138 start_codon:yes stop_codon:yes gene_type:complete
MASLAAGILPQTTAIYLVLYAPEIFLGFDSKTFFYSFLGIITLAL